MNPDTPNQPIPPVNNPLAVMQPGEHVICEIKRHPFGILTIFAAEGLLLIILAVFALVVAPNMLGGDSRGTVTAIGGAFFFVFAVVSLTFVFIANVVYWGNRWVVTSDSITQVRQTGLFHKQSSQLSFGNLEDITAEQNGMLPQFFHFGTLKAETAGESSKFIFMYCPNPNYFAQKILAAREVFEQSVRKEVIPAQMQPSPSNQPPAYEQALPTVQPTAEPPQPTYPAQPLPPSPAATPLPQQPYPPNDNPAGPESTITSPW
jgi:hypothetical protein